MLTLAALEFVLTMLCYVENVGTLAHFSGE